MSSGLDRINRAAAHLSGELARLNGEELPFLATSLEEIAGAICKIQLSSADPKYIATLMCRLLASHGGDNLPARATRTLVYGMCLKVLREKSTRMGAHRLELASRSGAWVRVLQVIGSNLALNLYFRSLLAKLAG